MSWWRKAQQVMMKPSVRLKKSVSDTVSLLQKRGDDLAKRTSKDLQNRVEKGVSDLGTRAGNVSSSLKIWTVDVGKRARKRTEKAMSNLSSKVAQEARALPSKTAEGFSTPLARRRSSCPPPSPNLGRTHLVERYQAFRDSAPCLSRATTSRRARNWSSEVAHLVNTILDQPYRRRVSTDWLNPEDSQLAAPLEGDQHSPGSSTIELPSALAKSGAYPPDRALPGPPRQSALPLACHYLPKGTKLELGRGAHLENTILNQPYRRRVSANRLNPKDSQLAAFLESEPGLPPAGKALPHVQAAKQAAMGAAVAGTNAAKSAASAGAQAVTDAGRQASNRVWDAMPKLGGYMTWTFRRIAYLVFGTAFLYGVGTSLPGAVARYYAGMDRRREEARTSTAREGDESDPSALSSEDKGVGAVQERSQSLLELIYKWFRNQ